MIRTLIVDDEEKNRVAIKALVGKHCTELEIVGEAASSNEGCKKIEELKPQLVLLDVKMPGHSGFAMLKTLKQIDFEVIFITAYDRYAIHAFEFNAVDYILKPVSVTRLVAAVERAVERIETKSGSEPVIHFIQTLSEADDVLQKISVHHNGKVILLSIAEISHIESKEDSTIINLADNSHYYSSKDLQKFEALLQDNAAFLRVNRSVLINTAYLRSYSKGTPCMIEMKNGTVFEVSKRRKNEILQILKTS